MEIKEIGEQITFTSNKGEHTAEIVGRNWSFERLVSYIVRFNGYYVPICAESLKCQLAAI